MTQNTKSWIRNESTRPLCQLRKGLQGVLDSFEHGEATPKLLQERVNKLWDSLEESCPGAFRAERTESTRAIKWLEQQDQSVAKTPTYNSENNSEKEKIRIEEPSYQAIWGFVLLANKKLKSPKIEEEVLKGNKRLIQEKNLMGSLLLGTIQNKNTTICWGKSGSWFYHDPVNNHINMDPGQALLLGLQNSRGILLHEIGHSQITKDRSPRLNQIRKEIESLCPKGPKGLRLVPKDPKDRMKVAELSREANYRETFWQYAEDACVNTYAEIEGLNFTNDIQTALLRVYAVTLLGREAKKIQEESKKAIVGKSNPLKDLIDKLSKAGKKVGTTSKSSEEEKEGEKKEIEELLEERLKAAGASYPISRGWMDKESQEDWQLIGSKLKEENSLLVEELCQELTKSNELLPVASMQPSIIAKRFELVSESSLSKITTECAEKRNETIDALFDKYFLPLIEKLPPPPELPTTEIEFDSGEDGEKKPNPGNQDKEGDKGKSGKSDQSKDDDKKKEDGTSSGQSKEDPKGKDEKGEQGSQGKEGKDQEDSKKDYSDIVNSEGEEARKEVDNTVEDQTSTLEEASKKNQEEKEKADAEEKKRAKDQQIAHGEAIKNSMGQRSPLEDLPTGCGNYEEAAKACQPQIGIIVSILKKIAMKQKVKSPGRREILPDPLMGAQSFELDSFIERKKKEQSQEMITLDDRKHFTHEERKKTEPATTHLAFYIDGSGSMGGNPAEKTMLTLVIFNEASKKVPEIQISAVYSGAGKTRLLLSGGKVCPGEEQLISDILCKGYAYGDNEISAGGMSEMITAVSKVVPRTGAFGCTHTIFLTDGGSAPRDREPIAKALETNLNDNPLATFDTLVVDGATETNFHKSLALVKPKRKVQEPTIKECRKVSDICPTIANTLLNRIREFKSFEPKSITSTKKTFKKLSKKLADQEQEILTRR
jgi:hypothetical protein